MKSVSHCWLYFSFNCILRFWKLKTDFENKSVGKFLSIHIMQFLSIHFFLGTEKAKSEISVVLIEQHGSINLIVLYTKYVRYKP
jgi:hypothetical protein